MNLYLITQDTNRGHGHYDAAIVAAASEQEARSVHPSGQGSLDTEGIPTGDWVATPEEVAAELIGVAAKGIAAGVICASFNAG